MILRTEVLNQPSFDFRYFEGIQIFQVCKVGGFQTRSEFTTSACWSYKEGGVKTRLVDEYRFGPIDGERFVHRFVLCLHLLCESIARCFIPLCIAHILSTEERLALFITLFITYPKTELTNMNKVKTFISFFTSQWLRLKYQLMVHLRKYNC
jgi:hypothetical protein